MLNREKNYPVFRLLCVLVLMVNLGCTDPVVPEYEYKEGLVYVDAYVSTSLGASFVRITETSFVSEKLKDLFVKGATVSYRNVDTGLQVTLMESDGVYVPPKDFYASVGDVWELLITFRDGRRYRSKQETIVESVGFSNLKATYNKELAYREGIDDFVPGHFVSLNIDDPGDEENYYFWTFRSFEKLKVCGECLEKILRGGKCIESDGFIQGGRTISYGCETDCWQIRYNEDIRIFSDEFTNGIETKGIPVGDVLLYSKNDILVEIQQYSLSAAAYKYYRVIKDIVDNNGGFNAPPPAALIGNMFNPEDPNEFVLGRFTAASAVIESVFIERSQIEERSLEITTIAPETCRDVCPGSSCSIVIPIPPECMPVLEVPCEESRFRTQIRPEDWVDI